MWRRYQATPDLTSLGKQTPDARRYDSETPSNPARPEPDLPVECPAHTTERKLVTKMDLRIIPVLSILYLLAFLDRTNIANASIFGLQQDLGLKKTEYNNALTIFFVPYILFEIPSNILLKKLKPHVWLSGCMFLFGLVTICQGLVQNYHGLLVTRFFLGLAESGMFPGSFYLIGMWYKRSEAQRRFSFFFSSTSLAGAFGGLLASAIGKMDGMKGYLGWRWIFILEGTLTCVVSSAFFFIIPGFPEDVKWLRDDERVFVEARLRNEQGRSAVERPITFRDVVNVFKDYKIFVGGFMYLGLIVPAYGYAFFAPGIIKLYGGYTPIGTQLHSVPPWVCAFAGAMLVAFASDRIQHRFAFTLLSICVTITGYAILLTVHTNLHVQYAALFLAVMGTYGAMPVVICWFNMNIGGHHRRAVASAWQIGFGNIGGIIATFAFLDKDRPRFKPGFSICISFVCLSAASCVVYFLAIWMENRRRDAEAASGKGKEDGLTEEEKEEMGDLSPDYRYLL